MTITVVGRGETHYNSSSRLRGSSSPTTSVGLGKGSLRSGREVVAGGMVDVESGEIMMGDTGDRRQ